MIGWELGVVLGLVCLALCFEIGRRTHAIMGMAAGWIAASALRVFAFPVSPFEGNTAAWISALDQSAVRSLLEFSLITACAWLVRPKHLVYGFQMVATINAALIIAGAMVSQPYGILGNASMSGCFAVALMPILPAPAVILSLIAAMLTMRHMPFACLLVLGWAFYTRKNRVWMALIPAFLIVPAMLFDSNGRFDVWMVSLKYWNEQSNRFTGFGSGSFFAIGPAITAVLPDQFVWMHSDWLQILWEQGIVGLGLSVLIFLYLARKAPQRVFYALMVFGMWGTANMPLRYPLAALYGAAIVRLALWEQDQKA